MVKVYPTNQLRADENANWRPRRCPNCPIIGVVRLVRPAFCAPAVEKAKLPMLCVKGNRAAGGVDGWFDGGRDPGLARRRAGCDDVTDTVASLPDQERSLMSSMPDRSAHRSSAVETAESTRCDGVAAGSGRVSRSRRRRIGVDGLTRRPVLPAGLPSLPAGRRRPAARAAGCGRRAAGA